MRWKLIRNALIFQYFRAKILHNNALDCAEVRWNLAKNALKCADFSKFSAQKPDIIIR